jgi:hypothetical protein
VLVLIGWRSRLRRQTCIVSGERTQALGWNWELVIVHKHKYIENRDLGHPVSSSVDEVSVTFEVEMIRCELRSLKNIT